MISVCIATYNGEKYIKEQILSILPQLSEDDEIIISDDGSKDSTIAIIESLQSPIIHIVYNQGIHGYTPNFENALRHAKGDYIFLSDQDDIWTTDKVSICMDYFKTADFIISDADIIDGEGNFIVSSYYAERQSRPGVFNNLLRFSYLGCVFAFKRNVLIRALPFPPNHRKATHDNWLGIIGMAYFRTVIIPNKLIHYRRHTTNTSLGGLKPSTTAWFKISYRLYIIKWLCLRFF